MVWLKVEQNAHVVRDILFRHGVKVLALTDNLLRVVFHLDVGAYETKRVCEIIATL